MALVDSRKRYANTSTDKTRPSLLRRWGPLRVLLLVAYWKSEQPEQPKPEKRDQGSGQADEKEGDPKWHRVVLTPGYQRDGAGHHERHCTDEQKASPAR